MVAYASDYDGPSVDRLRERRRRLVRAYGDSEDAYGEAEYESVRTTTRSRYGRHAKHGGGIGQVAVGPR